MRKLESLERLHIRYNYILCYNNNYIHAKFKPRRIPFIKLSHLRYNPNFLV